LTAYFVAAIRNTTEDFTTGGATGTTGTVENTSGFTEEVTRTTGTVENTSGFTEEVTETDSFTTEFITEATSSGTTPVCKGNETLKISDKDI